MTNCRGLRLRSITVAAMLLVGLVAGCGGEQQIDRVSRTPYLGLPAGIDHLVTLEVGRMFERDFFRQMLRNLEEDPEQAEQLRQMREDLGLDPFKDIQTVSMGVRGNFSQAGENQFANTVWIVRGNFASPEPMLDKLHTFLDREILIAPPPFSRSTHGETGYPTFSLRARGQYREDIEFHLNFGFPNEQLMVFSFNQGLLAESLDVIAGVTPGVGADEGWREMLRRPQLGTLLWGTGNFNASSEMLQAMGGASGLPAVRQYFFNFTMGTRVDARLGLVCDTIERATSMARDMQQSLQQMRPMLAFMLGGQMPETVKMLERIAVLPKGDVVEVSLSLNEQDTSALKLEWQRASEQAQGGTLPLLDQIQPPLP